ncbi:MAG TPA: hypothetical protein VLB84_03090 [Bacteroidia bacterium]|nr:hypothetical protein [Bacteroidia bacterium]
MYLDEITEMNYFYNQLKELVDRTFNNFENFSLHEASDGANTFLAKIYDSILVFHTKTPKSIEFSLFGEQFFLEAVIYPSANKCVMFNTYQIVNNRKSYPNKEMILIPEMAIMQTIDGLYLHVKTGDAIAKFNFAYINTLCDFYRSTKIIN